MYPSKDYLLQFFQIKPLNEVNGFIVFSIHYASLPSAFLFIPFITAKCFSIYLIKCSILQESGTISFLQKVFHDSSRVKQFLSS